MYVYIYISVIKYFNYTLIKPSTPKPLNPLHPEPETPSPKLEEVGGLILFDTLISELTRVSCDNYCII